MSTIALRWSLMPAHQRRRLFESAITASKQTRRPADGTSNQQRERQKIQDSTTSAAAIRLMVIGECQSATRIVGSRIDGLSFRPRRRQSAHDRIEQNLQQRHHRDEPRQSQDSPGSTPQSHSRLTIVTTILLVFASWHRFHETAL
jgi:hypothetical protein